MINNKKQYSNIVALAREDEREYRIVNGMNSDVLSNRWYYKTCLILKILSFVVLAATTALFIGGAVTELIGSCFFKGSEKEIAEAIAELKYAIAVSSVSLFFLSVGSVLSLLKKGENPRPVFNIIGASLIFVFALFLCVFLFFAAKSSLNYYDGGRERFIWCFAVPGAVLAVSALAQAILGALENGADKARYEAVLLEVFDKFKENRQDEVYSEEEWEEFAAAYSRNPKPTPVPTKRKKTTER